MKQISIQYFTTFEELIMFFEDISKYYKLNIAHLYTIDDKDYIRLASLSFLEDAVIDGSIYNCLVFSKEKIKIGQNTHFEFQIANPNSLYVNIGKFNPSLLRESWIYNLKIINNVNDHKIWLEVEKKLKKIILSGGWGVYISTGEKQFYKNLRYTIGAKKLFEAGIKMLTSGNNIYFELENKHYPKPTN